MLRLRQEHMYCYGKCPYIVSTTDGHADTEFMFESKHLRQATTVKVLEPRNVIMKYLYSNISCIWVGINNIITNH